MSEVKLPPLPEPAEWNLGLGAPLILAYSPDQMTDYAKEAVEAERARLLPLLEHAVRLADSWHDDSRGGQIKGDPIMDAARAEVRDKVR